ncbi:hypothetical protein BANRA_03853 [Klebsiella variicola]|nr:hypothetical protein BANRA_03853 [Klebsiella variicola]
MGNIIFDTRWIGEHGIGRFAKELFKIDGSFLPIKLTGNPASKFDVLKLTIYRLANRKDYFFRPVIVLLYFSWIRLLLLFMTLIILMFNIIHLGLKSIL